MGTLTVALLQLAAHGADLDANLAKGEQACRRAAALGADLALFPEMWSIGYTFSADPGGRAAMARRAVGPGDPFVERFRALARELGMAIALTYLERGDPLPRNSISLIDRRGEIRLTYAKVHTCDFDAEAALAPGDEFAVADLDTAAGPVRLGAMICYDREFPESARILMLQGAEIVLVPNACEMEDNRTSQLRARAFENMIGIALANYAAPQQDGHSVAFDAVAFEDGHSVDPTIVRAGRDEDVVLARFDLDRLRAYRATETWGDAYRRPSRYGPLVSAQVRTPFVRPDARR